MNRRLLKRALKREKRKGYTMDIDATGIEAEKESAKMTYKGYRGYMPMVGHLAENGLIVGDEFGEGNDSPGSRNLEFVRYCERQLPKGKKIKAFRSDSAAYQAKVNNHCQEKGIEFAIGGDLDAAVKDVIRNMTPVSPAFAQLGENNTKHILIKQLAKRRGKTRLNLSLTNTQKNKPGRSRLESAAITTESLIN